MSSLSKVEMSPFTFFAIINGKGGKENVRGDYQSEQKGT